MEQYPSNTLKEQAARAEKAEKPELKCVVKGKSHLVQKSRASHIFEGLNSDGKKTMSDFIIGDILVPLIQRAVVEGVTGAVNFLVKGDIYADKRDRRDGGGRSRISYTKYYDDQKRDYSRISEPRSNRLDIDDVWFGSRVDAQRVLDEMESVIAQYDILTVGGFYDIIGETAPSWTAEKFGWTDIRSAYITASRGGWIIHLPRALPIDNL